MCFNLTNWEIFPSISVIFMIKKNIKMSCKKKTFWKYPNLVG